VQCPNGVCNLGLSEHGKRWAEDDWCNGKMYSSFSIFFSQKLLIYAHMCVCLYIYICTHIYLAFLYSVLRSSLYIYIYIYVYMCMYIYIQLFYISFLEAHALNIYTHKYGIYQ
jgi:hypothetical protein